MVLLSDASVLPSCPWAPCSVQPAPVHYRASTCRTTDRPAASRAFAEESTWTTEARSGCSSSTTTRSSPSSLAMVLDDEPDLKSVGRRRHAREGPGDDRDDGARRHPARPPAARRRRRRRDRRAPGAAPERRRSWCSRPARPTTSWWPRSRRVPAGFVSKSRSLDELTAAVRAAAPGESVISPEMLARLLPRLQRDGRARHNDLTEREREVLDLLADGLVERRDRRAAVRQRAHRAQPHRQPLGQARRPLQAGGPLDRGARRPAARAVTRVARRLVPAH